MQHLLDENVRAADDRPQRDAWAASSPLSCSGSARRKRCRNQRHASSAATSATPNVHFPTLERDLAFFSERVGDVALLSRG